MIGERDEASAKALEKLTRKIGILSLLPATQRTDLCRRMNVVKCRNENEPLFRQGEYCIDFYIPIVGSFNCTATLHTEVLDRESGGFYPPTVVQNVVSAGRDMYFEQGVGIEHQFLRHPFQIAVLLELHGRGLH